MLAEAQAEEPECLPCRGCLAPPAPWEGEQGYVPMPISASPPPTTQSNWVISCVCVCGHKNVCISTKSRSSPTYSVMCWESQSRPCQVLQSSTHHLASAGQQSWALKLRS